MTRRKLNNPKTLRYLGKKNATFSSETFLGILQKFEVCKVHQCLTTFSEVRTDFERLLELKQDGNVSSQRYT